MAKRNSYATHRHLGMSIFCVLMTLIILAACVLGGLQLWGTGKTKPSEWFKSDPAAETPADPTAPEDPAEPESSGVLDENGSELPAGEVVELPTAMLFTAPLGASSPTDEGEGVTVTATMKPDNVIDKSVVFSVAFKNADSEWASGKDPNEYVSLETVDETSVKVKCETPFAEQILLSASTVTPNEEGSPITKTCTVDYLQRVTNVSAKIGEIDVVLGGNTNVTVLAGRSSKGAGGVISETHDVSDVYTIAETYTQNITFTGGNLAAGEDEDYISFGRAGGGGALTIFSYDDIENAAGQSIYFDRRLFSDYNFKQVTTAMGDYRQEILFADLTSEQINTEYFTPRKGKKLWDIKITFKGTNHEDHIMEFTSALRWEKIDVTVPSTELELNKQEIVF